MSDAQYQIVLTTCPDTESAGKIARALIQDGHAACVNIVPAVESIYKWKGNIESAREHLLIIKAPTRSYASIEAHIRALHPYELPEVVAVPIGRGSAAYLGWLDNPDQNSHSG
jgi:periplasmic divalent cation tolerance protein